MATAAAEAPVPAGDVPEVVPESNEAKVEETKLKKKAAAPKKRSRPTHPPFLEMIGDAIVTLKERTGSSQQAIQKFIEEKHKELPASFRKLLLVQLKRLVASGKLTKVKNSYKLPASRAPAVAAAPAKAKKPKTVAKPKAAAKPKPKPKPAAKPKAKVVAAKPKPAAKPKAKVAVKPKPKPAAKPKAKAAAKPKPATKPKAATPTKRKAPEKAKPAAKSAKTSAKASPAAKKKAAVAVKPKKSPAKKPTTSRLTSARRVLRKK